MSVSAILLKVEYVNIVKHYVSVSPPLLSVEYVKISVKHCLCFSNLGECGICQHVQLCVVVSPPFLSVEYVNM